MKPVSTARRFCRRRAAAFTLLEGLLALAVFGLLGVGLARSLAVAGAAADDFRHDFHVASVVEGLLDERAWGPEVIVGSRKLGPDGEGVVYETSVEPLPLKNREGTELEEIYRIRVLATWDRGLGETTYAAETFRYAPLFAEAPR